MAAKKSLFLWSDNNPLYYHTNCVLEHYFDGMKMTSDYYADKIITKSMNFEEDKNSHFDGKHSIFYGVNNLYEGVTICHPEKIHPDF